jgi:hypothetical protein
VNQDHGPPGVATHPPAFEVHSVGALEGDLLGLEPDRLRCRLCFRGLGRGEPDGDEERDAEVRYTERPEERGGQDGERAAPASPPVVIGARR